MFSFGVPKLNKNGEYPDSQAAVPKTLIVNNVN